MTLALVAASAIVNLRNPQLTSGLRLVWWAMLVFAVGSLVSLVGYALYASARARRRRRDAPNGP
jgi:hypothetical protein